MDGGHVGHVSRVSSPSCIFLYNWKAGGLVTNAFKDHHWFPFGVPEASWLAWLRRSRGRRTFSAPWLSPSALPGFYYSLAYCLCVVIFGIKRMQKRRTPYVKVQTLTLMAVQTVPLFPAPVRRPSVVGAQRLVRPGRGAAAGRSAVPGDAVGPPRARILARVRAHPRVASVHLERLHVQADGSLARDLRSFRRSSSSRRSSTGGGRARIAAGSARAARSPRRWETRTGTRCRTASFWNRLNMVGQVVLAVALILAVLRTLSWIWPNSV